ncbi:ribosome maturation factor RimM [Bacteroidota bacterium]
MIKLGIITGTRGFDGTLFIDYLTDDFLSISDQNTVKIGFSEQFSREFIIEKIIKSKKGLFLKLIDINAKEEAMEFKEQAIFISEEDIIRKSKKKHISGELFGCEVFNIDSGDRLGKIVEELNLPANDVWVVDSHGNEILIPVIDEIVKMVDTNKKRIEIKVIPGLLEANTKSNDEDYDGRKT